jgi:hypothetical protein
MLPTTAAHTQPINNGDDGLRWVQLLDPGIYWAPSVVFACGQRRPSLRDGACKRVSRVQRDADARQPAVCHRGQPLARIVAGTSRELDECGRSGLPYDSTIFQPQYAG